MATTDSATTGYEIADDFTEAYANNVYFETSAWDMKLIFGQLDQSGGKVRTVQHTAITLPWAQLKLLAYWIKGHVEAYEMINGKIYIPPSVIPPEVPAPTQEGKDADPNVQAVYSLFSRIRNEFLASLK
jgi:hypothetical protein